MINYDRRRKMISAVEYLTRENGNGLLTHNQCFLVLNISVLVTVLEEFSF